MNQHIHKILLSLRDLLSPPACCCLDAEDLEKDESWSCRIRVWCGNGAPEEREDGHYSPDMTPGGENPGEVGRGIDHSPCSRLGE